jgi:hypothetical protein
MCDDVDVDVISSPFVEVRAIPSFSASGYDSVLSSSDGRILSVAAGSQFMVGMRMADCDNLMSSLASWLLSFLEAEALFARGGGEISLPRLVRSVDDREPPEVLTLRRFGGPWLAILAFSCVVTECSLRRVAQMDFFFIARAIILHPFHIEHHSFRISKESRPFSGLMFWFSEFLSVRHDSKQASRFGCHTWTRLIKNFILFLVRIFWKKMWMFYIIEYGFGQKTRDQKSSAFKLLYLSIRSPAYCFEFVIIY